MSYKKSLPTTLSREIWAVLAGDKLGRGANREVYTCNLDPTSVVKVERLSGSFSNIIEWETWLRVELTEFAKWFAPCSGISPNGLILIQKKARPAMQHEFPDKIPAFFTDLKPSNFGMIGNQFVAVDYGYHLLWEKGMTKAMKKVKWEFGDV